MPGQGKGKRDAGLVIKCAGMYVSAILANGRPENPVVYFTKDLEQAKAWALPQTARKARAKMKRGGEILLFETRDGKRVEIGKLGKAAEKEERK